jgi:hypothetical protein
MASYVSTDQFRGERWRGNNCLSYLEEQGEAVSVISLRTQLLLLRGATVVLSIKMDLLTF